MNTTRLMWQLIMWISLILATCAIVLAFAASWEGSFMFISLLLGQAGLMFSLLAIVAVIKDVSS